MTWSQPDILFLLYLSTTIQCSNLHFPDLKVDPKKENLVDETPLDRRYRTSVGPPKYTSPGALLLDSGGGGDVFMLSVLLDS